MIFDFISHFLLIILSTGMMCQAKTSYIEPEIEWGARFDPCMTLEKVSFRVDLRRFHSTYVVPLPTCSASQAHQLTKDSLRASKDWGTWVEGMPEENKDKQPSHGGFTIGNIQEEGASECQSKSKSK